MIMQTNAFDVFLLQYAVPVSAMLTFVFAFNLAIIKWLSGKFKFYEDLARSIEKNAFKMMDKHESEDQKRHDEAMLRFEKINIALARLGAFNGLLNKGTQDSNG